MRALRAGVFTVACVLLIASCRPLYGANYDYPPDLPIPISATVVLTDYGWDEDDPIRSTIHVVDFGDANESAILDFYQQAFPESEGWTLTDADPDEIVCLFRHENGDYAELVEVLPYEGTRVARAPGRMLAISTRITDPWDEPCGVAMSWVPGNLVGDSYWPDEPSPSPTATAENALGRHHSLRGRVRGARRVTVNE